MSLGPSLPAVRSECASLEPREAREIQRLLDAETDLERAIAECQATLQEVRRELRGRDSDTPPVVH